MKKVFIASAIAMAMSAGSAMAANQQAEVQFLGVVTEKTCDITPDVNGNTTNLVQLGTVGKGETGQWIDFALKAKNPADAGCTSLTNTNTATVVFQGALDTSGLTNTSGSATDATVALKTKNAKADQDIKQNMNSVDFEANKIVNEGYKFQAQLTGGQVAGTFESALAYAVTYK
ncbi:fimbrial protein [Salmonella enterica]|nr:fimbrial protein [Salmonella enterica]ELL9309722.1 fimbrial protein [Escherichia coli]